MRESGSPRFAVNQAGRIFTPTDLGVNVLPYLVGVGAAVYSNIIAVAGYGMWSCFILVTGAGNVELYLQIMEETIETNVLGTYAISTTITAGAYRHVTFGPIGSNLPIVPFRSVRFQIFGTTNAGNATMRISGRHS